MDENKIQRLLPGVVTLDIRPMLSGKIKVEATRHVNPEGIKRAVGSLLRGFGVDQRDPNFTETPKRVTKLWVEWLKPIEIDLKVFPSDSKGAVTLINHTSVSVCPHHLLPFEIDIDLAYVPQGYVVGLSKLARLADLACASFALQEHIPEFIVKILSALLIPKGVICRSRARHGCMRARGVKTTGEVATTALDGVYLTDEKARNEFLMEVIK